MREMKFGKNVEKGKILPKDLEAYTRKVPLVLILCIKSKCFIDVSSVPVKEIALALLIKISILPNFSTVDFTAFSTDSSSRTSTAQAKPRPPTCL